MADADKKATAQDVIDTLRSIDATLKLMAEHSGAIRAPQSAPNDNRPVPSIASDADLDGKWGDPEVKAKSPRDWTGESQQGKRFSECPAEYLDMVADRLDYFAGNEDDPKKQRYNRLDASRARGWAKRIRAGYVPPVADETAAMTADDVAFSWFVPFALMVLSAGGMIV